MAYDSTNTGAEVDAAIAKVAARSGDLIDGSGNTNKVAKFSGANTITDSIITDSGSTVTVAGALTASGDLTVDTTTLKVDSTNNRVGIGTVSPAVPLDVNGQARVVGNFFVGTDDTTPNGMIEVYGGGTGQNEGGEIRLRTAADFDPPDSAYNYYFIDAYRDDLRIGREGGADITLASDGNVGIGAAATSPSEKLHVKSSNSDTAETVAGFGNGDIDVGLQIKTNGNGGSSLDWGFNAVNSRNLVFETNQNERVRIDSSGNVGIGTESPSHKLEVDGDAVIGNDTTGNARINSISGDSAFGSGNVHYTFKGNEGTGMRRAAANTLAFDTASNERVRIDSSGNVGIGTSDPDYLLDINDDAATGVGIRVTGGGGGGPLARFIRDVVSSGTVEINIAGGDPQFKLTSAGSDVFAFGVDDSANSFQICSGSAVGSNVALAVTSSSNVGIGTDLPSHRLDVNSGGTNQVALFESTDATAYIELADNTGSVQFITPSNGGLRIATGGAGAGSVGTSGLFIDQSQNVGINDDTPSYKLDVNGTARVTGNATFDGTISQNISGTASYFPGYHKDTFGAQLEDAGANGSTLYLGRDNQYSLALGTSVGTSSTDEVAVFHNTDGNVGGSPVVSTKVGNITITASTVALNSTSDYRAKENVVDLTDGISRLKELKPYRFNFIRDPNTIVDGFFAHEVSPFVPEAVCGEKDQVDEEGNPEYQGIDQSKLVPLLTAALKEAVAKIEALEARVAVLEG